MSLKEFEDSLKSSHPPQGISDLLKALWYDAKGHWETAHDLAQEVDSGEGAWVHAYLHRKEGDLSNASYWYHRAKRQLPTLTLEEEWKSIASELLLE